MSLSLRRTGQNHLQTTARIWKFVAPKPGDMQPETGERHRVPKTILEHFRLIGTVYHSMHDQLAASQIYVEELGDFCLTVSFRLDPTIVGL